MLNELALLAGFLFSLLCFDSHAICSLAVLFSVRFQTPVPETRQSCTVQRHVDTMLIALLAVGCRQYAVAPVRPTTDKLMEMPVTLLHQLLYTVNVEHGHLSKAALVEAVSDNFDSLPLAVRANVTALAEAPTKDLARTDVLHALAARTARLQPDEQYSVRLFQVRASYSSVHL